MEPLYKGGNGILAILEGGLYDSVGHNPRPVAILARLLLMSYTRILKIVIEVYSSVELDYPSRTATVWFKDANVPYLQSESISF